MATDMEQARYQQPKNKLKISIKAKPLAYHTHFHNEIEVVYMIEGESTVLIDKTEYTLSSGDMVVIFPFQVHSYRNDVGSPHRILMIYHPDCAPAFRNILSGNAPDSPILKNASDHPELLELLKSILRERKQKLAYYSEAELAYLSAFNASMLRYMPVSPVSDQGFSTVHTILHYCSVHYREPLTLAKLSSELHIHRSYISVIFSQRLRISFNDYLNSLRIDDARRLLSDTDDTITSISAAVGFETIRTFNRAFQRICGMTPSKYRDNHRAKKD